MSRGRNWCILSLVVWEILGHILGVYPKFQESDSFSQDGDCFFLPLKVRILACYFCLG